ncbi:copper homeostasis protein CutC [Vibrio sp. 10N.261.46.E12]|uniref:copper homeostasis protein CutC n=1 Tax=unclassified Vibrio TaxID=2614977 RepID=UPI0009771337|nr:MULTISPECIES: copper homeostasis protein CutC [unclassified Vibrio]OMO33847.1 copper homeostasis protein CutC [Vibrio sp. 10N.261.45.E1]PMJ21220.1 copper homeostasis protein CutC [Vibrio sp. 10N.286.45.B6]PML92939.1 copper homeostasis protein CutC [Vibrio sp. 10N.261.49.E11]PMM73021.1 copper homeostasis protein CutC [Vibrio sp. 10N.261.46.F12]PMM80876.1 copper homeostasis protein CutC [Vibrio sp. 10N.261.46.E8]
MNVEIEVCIDNLESLHNALTGGADRIELCSSLALGGLTPSFGMMKQAARISSVPVYAMIRPRQGDFIFDDDDMLSMFEDIEACASAGLDGVVLGVLAPNGSIDIPKMQQLADKAHSLKLGITFHRAIDQSSDFQTALEQVIELGCERILTSGLAVNAEQGIDVLTAMVKQADGRIDIMAGAGVNAANAKIIQSTTQVPALHLSGKSTRLSLMESNSNAQMGHDDVDDYQIPVTDAGKISDVRVALTA